MKTDTVIARTDKFEVRSSEIHGWGGFAACDIEAGEQIIEYAGEKITKKESNKRGLARLEESMKDGGAAVFIFELDKRYDLDGDHPDNIAKHINHSCNPNCEAVNIDNHIWICALRDIEAGEELSFDYGYDLEHFLEHPCLCGAPRCVGYIVRDDLRKKLKQILRDRGKKKKKGGDKKKKDSKKPSAGKDSKKKKSSKKNA